METTAEDDVAEWEMDPKFLLEARTWIIKNGWAWTLGLILIWPAATVPWGVLDKALYSIWASVAFIWGWLAAIMIIGLPIYENRTTVLAVLTWTPVDKQLVKSVSATSKPQATEELVQASQA